MGNIEVVPAFTDWESVTDSTTGTAEFERCSKGYFTSMNDHAARFCGLPNGKFTLDEPLTEWDFAWGENTGEAIYEEDHEVLRTGKPSRHIALLSSANGDWAYVKSTKWTPDGKRVRVRAVIWDLRDNYMGWYERLDHERRVLKLHNGNILTEKELDLLHQFMMGIPRKVMADYFHVSVKTIEYRLQRCKEKLCQGGSCCVTTLHSCLAENHLTSFITDRGNWFDLKPYVLL